MRYIKAFENFNLNKHLKVSKTNRYVYHTSNPIFREDIEKCGLIPKGKSETWLSDTNINGKVIFASNSYDKSKWFDSTYDDDIYQIDTLLIKNVWFFDPNFGDNSQHIITFDSIPKTAIKLIKKGSGYSSEEVVTIEDWKKY